MRSRAGAVRVLHGGQPLEGLARGVDGDGALLLESDGVRAADRLGRSERPARFGDRYRPMRLAFALLLFANIAWYGWTHWVAAPDEPAATAAARGGTAACCSRAKPRRHKPPARAARRLRTTA